MRLHSLVGLMLCLFAWSAHAQSPPRVVLTTSMGTMVLELDPVKAPVSTENFLAYVRDGFYNETIFHRVIDRFVLQGGGFTADFTKKKTRPPIKNEADNGLKNLRGTISMARTPHPDSASSQFFINLEDNANLDHKSRSQSGWGYAVFGRLVEGLDVMDKIRRVATGSHAAATGQRYGDVPVTPVIIRTAVVAAAQTTE